MALLYAPAAGRETREVPRREGARGARERAAAAAAKGREVINQGRETLTTAIERGREAYQQARAGERVSGWRDVFLGVIAVATLATAIVADRA